MEFEVDVKNTNNVPKDTTESAAALVCPSGLKPDELPSSWYFDW